MRWLAMLRDVLDKFVNNSPHVLASARCLHGWLPHASFRAECAWMVFAWVGFSISLLVQGVAWMVGPMSLLVCEVLAWVGAPCLCCCRVLHGCFAPCPCMCAGCLHGWSLHVSVAQRVAWMVGPMSLPMSMVFAWGVSMSLLVQGAAWMLDGAGCLLRLAMLRDILETLWLDA